MLAKYATSYFASVPGVYGDSAGNYTGCIMRDSAAYGSGCGGWHVPDGKKWWVATRRTASERQLHGNLLLSMYKWDVNDLQFDDGNWRQLHGRKLHLLDERQVLADDTRGRVGAGAPNVSGARPLPPSPIPAPLGGWNRSAGRPAWSRDRVPALEETG